MNEIKKQITPPNSNKNKIDLSGAEVVKDTNNTEQLEQEQAEKEYVQNLNDQKEINLNDVGKKDVSQTATIDFMNEESIEGYTASQTKKSDPAPDENKKSRFEGQTIDEVKAQITKEENDSAKKFTLKDMEEIAGFIIELIDTGFSSAFNWWAGDTAVSSYSLQKSKKDMLSYQLALILVKYQAKFKIEFMFLLSLIIMYAPAFMAAKRRKTEIKQGYVNAQNKKQGQHSTYEKKMQDEIKKEDTGLVDEIKDNVANLGALKRRPGRKPKI